MRLIGRVLLPLTAAALAVGCILGAVALGQQSKPSYLDALRKGPTAEYDFPMDFGVYVTSSTAGELEGLAQATAVQARIPQPPSTWNVRFATTKQVLVWFGPADDMSLFEGIQTASNRSGLWHGDLTAPIKIQFVLPASARSVDTCASWWDAAGHHTVRAQVHADTPWEIVTCEIPAIGAFDSLQIAVAFDWGPPAVGNPLLGTSIFAIENQANPLLPFDVGPPTSESFGNAQPLQVDVFSPAGSSVIETTPSPASQNPIEGRWVLSPGSSLFVAYVDDFRRSLSDGLGQLLLIGAGAFFAIAVERVFSSRNNRSSPK
ncbi:MULTISPECIES: hypothetical protein [unclassified Microbacterium]|uniref:hypothetical protein n=1 Tax=unclassified Microbacterium TaxID=2609290 RepID=UPI003651D654